jgi:hypothetical protein
MFSSVIGSIGSLKRERAMSQAVQSQKLGFFGRAQVRLGIALDAILGLVVASRRHELCDPVCASAGTQAGPVVHDLADFEFVIAQTIPSMTERPSRGFPSALRPAPGSQPDERRRPDLLKAERCYHVRAIEDS